MDHVDSSGSWYEGRLRKGVEAACRKYDFNLLVVVGRPLRHPNRRIAANNIVYDLVSQNCADGVILIAGTLANAAGPEAVEEQARRYLPLPICSVGQVIPGIPSIVVDQRPGMVELMEHLLGHHGKRRIAFIGGPACVLDAALRFDVYREALERHGVPFDPSLIVEGDFYYLTAALGIARILNDGGTFDAVVAANDVMAMGAIRELKGRGIRVPRDLPVTGFDDVRMARIANPPLTTVRQPLEKIGVLAVEHIAAMLDHRDVASMTTEPCTFVLRRSCGCTDNVPVGYDRLIPDAASPAQFILEKGECLIDHLVKATRLAAETPTDWIRTLVDGLGAELRGQKEAFLGALELIIEDVHDQDSGYEDLQNVITQLRHQLGGAEDLEDLWHEARRMIGTGNARSQANQRWDSELSLQDLLTSAERFSVALDLSVVQRTMAEVLPRLGIRSASVARFRDQTLRELCPVLCLREGTVLETSGSFESTRLFSSELVTQETRHTWFVFALTSDTDAIGIAILEYKPGASPNEILPNQLGIALRNEALQREMLHRTALHERSVQERLATVKRLNALSQLAGGVAHDLNNAIGPIVALPDLIQQELTNLGLTEGSTDVLTDLATIKASALRASQTIKDLLTLGRGGRVQKEPLDLNRIVTACTQSTVFPSSNNTLQRIIFDIKISNEPLMIAGSEAHLIRAVSNLLRNAFEAIDGEGAVCVRTVGVQLEEPLSGYEPIEAGEYAMVSVSDTGRGIPVSELGRIFEPFFSRKKREEHGTGLGLAIVHAVTKDHSGFVNVVSSPGAGAEFALYFPRTSACAKSRDLADTAHRGAARVLVVDDDPMQLRTVRRILTRLGYEVETVSSGMVAWERFAKVKANQSDGASTALSSRPPDLVVFDMLLNEQSDGLEVFEKIRELYPAQRGVVVSGHAPTQRVKVALEKGLIWLSKPYTVDALAGAVKHALISYPPKTSERASGTPDRKQ